MWYCAAWSGLSHTTEGGYKWVRNKGGMMISTGKPKNPREMLQCNSVHHESYMKSMTLGQTKASTVIRQCLIAWATAQLLLLWYSVVMHVRYVNRFTKYFKIYKTIIFRVTGVFGLFPSSGILGESHLHQING
jgi:hypothetical protein